MKITPFQAHQINRVLRIVAVHGMARIRDLYIEAGTPLTSKVFITSY